MMNIDEKSGESDFSKNDIDLEYHRERLRMQGFLDSSVQHQKNMTPFKLARENKRIRQIVQWEAEHFDSGDSMEFMDNFAAVF